MTAYTPPDPSHSQGGMGLREGGTLSTLSPETSTAARVATPFPCWCLHAMRASLSWGYGYAPMWQKRCIRQRPRAAG